MDDTVRKHRIEDCLRPGTGTGRRKHACKGEGEGEGEGESQREIEGSNKGGSTCGMPCHAKVKCKEEYAMSNIPMSNSFPHLLSYSPFKLESILGSIPATDYRL